MVTIIDEPIRRGRPPGSSESIESLARKGSQRGFKFLTKSMDILEEEQERIEEELKKTDPSTDAHERLHRMIRDGQDSALKVVRDLARIAASDPMKAGDGDMDASTKEILAQLKGDGV